MSELGSPFSPVDNEHDANMFFRFRSFLLPFIRYWWVCVPFVCIGGAFQYYTAVETPDTWRSEGEMMLVGQPRVADSNYYQEYAVHFFGNEARLMQGPVVQQRAREYIRAQRPDWIEQGFDASINASHISDSRMFALSATGNHSEYTQAFLNACMESYLNYRQELRTSRTDAAMSQIDAEIARLDAEIQTLEDELQAFLSRNNMVFIREQASSAAGYLVSLSRNLAELESEYRLIELFDEVEANKTQSDAVAAAMGNLSKDGTNYIRALQRLRHLKAEQARFSKVLRPVHPKMKHFDREIEQVEILLTIYKHQNDQEVLDRKEILTVRIENLKNTIAEWKTRSIDLSSKLADYERINNKLERVKGLYERKLENLKGIDSAKNVVLEPIAISKKATPSTAQRVNVVNATMRGAFGGFGVGLLMIFLITRLRATVYTEHDLPKSKDVKVIAHIPRLNVRSKKVPLLKPDDKRYAFIEAFRNLRSMVLIDYPLEASKGAKFISVTSAIPSEGKSTVSSNLALSLAFSGHKILLIDADMRQGTQHKAFLADNEKGLTDLLQGKATIDEAIRPSDAEENLYILPRGQAVMNSSELLLTSYCRDLFEKARHEYDYVIVDTPPVMATDDVANLVNFVDGIFIVARMSLSSSKSLTAALKMLQARRAPIGGFILNSCDGSSTDYYYYRYKYYGGYGRQSVAIDKDAKDKSAK